MAEGKVVPFGSEPATRRNLADTMSKKLTDEKDFCCVRSAIEAVRNTAGFLRDSFAE